MPHLQRSKPKSFLDAARRDWQFDAFAWMLRHSGGYPKFLETELVLPIADHFPDRGLRGHAAVLALFRRVRDHAGMAEWPCTVEPETDGAGGAEFDAARIPIIYYQPDAEPFTLVAGFAHELARYLIGTFEEQAPGGAERAEAGVALAAVFMGFGVFLSNSVLASNHLDLNEGEVAHALAIFCLLRRLDVESVERHLNPHLRKYLRLAARDLAQHASKFQRLRSVFAVVPFDTGEHTLPTHAM